MFTNKLKINDSKKKIMARSPHLMCYLSGLSLNVGDRQ